MTQRLEVQKRREDQSKRQAEKRNKLAAEERRLKDLQKAALGEVKINLKINWYRRKLMGTSRLKQPFFMAAMGLTDFSLHSVIT